MTEIVTPTERPDSTDLPALDALGVDGLLVTFGRRLSEAANRAALAFRAALEHDAMDGITETAPALTSVYLRFDPAVTDHARLQTALTAMLAGKDWYRAPLPDGRRLWRVPAVFGTDLAPQLAEAAKLAGLTPDDAIAAFCARPLRVQTIGFAPGQPYLGELPPVWAIPRQAGLTAHVPEGALAVAIRQMVLFSVGTPTGWRHVGQSALRLFRPDQPDPFLLRPGDEVLFEPVAREALEDLRNRPDGGARAERLG